MDPNVLATDAGLIEAIAAGNHDALGQMYDRYHRPCFSFAIRTLGAERDAEEAVQETFVRVWRSAGQYDGTKASVGSWVLSITRNLCIDELRRRRRRAPETPFLEDAPDPPARERTEDEVVQKIVGEEVRAALQSLPADQRSAIELVYFRGLTSQEVGQLLNAPAPTVRSRLRLGLLKLAAVLQERGVAAVD